MKSLLRMGLLALLAVASAVAYSHNIDPIPALLAVGPFAAVPGQDIGAMFNEVFQPKAKFPRHWQPNAGIGLILVHSQEELDEYERRDWSPKPLPGSENPPPKLDSEKAIEVAKAELQAQMDKFAEQQKTFFQMVEDKMSTLPKAAAAALHDASADMAAATASGSDGAGSPVASGDDAATMVAGLSDASLSDAPEKPAKSGKK